jgi:hypothetical protein
MIVVEAFHRRDVSHKTGSRQCLTGLVNKDLR